MHHNSYKIPGFTLIEVMIAMAAGSILLAVGLSGFQTIMQTMTTAERSSEASEDAKILNEYLGANVQSLGGGAVRPWAAVNVLDNAGFDNTDIVQIYELDDSFPECTITSRSGNNLWFAKNAITNNCDCLTGVHSGLRVMITTQDGAYWGGLEVQNTNLGVCKANFNPVATGLDRLPGSPGDFVGGAMSVGRFKVFQVNSNNELEMVFDIDGDGTDDTMTLIDRVFDFQAALGYDKAPSDGIIVDNNDNTDEWAFNSGAANSDALGSGGLGTATGQDLRMLRLAVVIGAPVGMRDLRVAAQVLNGPQRSQAGWVMRSAMSSLSLRNLNIMQ